jgi:hypothetical protein
MKPTYWGPSMTDSQCAVFHFDVKTMSMRDAQGRDAPADKYACLIFNNVWDAERYCQDKIADTPALGCRIYSPEGTVVRTFVDEHVYRQNHGQPAAHRNLVVGGACLAVGVSCVAVDAWFGWSLIIGVVLGLRFLWVGTVKVAEGIAATLDGKRGIKITGRE